MTKRPDGPATTCRSRSAVGAGVATLLCATSVAAAPAPGGEAVPPGEAQAIAQIVGTIQSIVGAAAQAGEKPVLRDAHAKGHGCVHAVVKVRPDLAAALRQGVLAVPRRYQAWVRFSNGNGAPQDDHAGDGRGMAIKLIGVEGRKLLPDEVGAKTQDFVMINHPVFFIRNAVDYVGFTALTKANKANVFFATHPHEQAISRAITSQRVDHVFDQRYFSMTPYRLGNRYAKFGTRPVACGTGAPITASQAPAPVGDDNYLRDDMVRRLAASDACFVLAMQLQTDPATMPIEDPTIEWDAAKSPFVPVADITIERQRFDTSAQQTYCENLSFTPWHSLAAHAPVGGINRVRREVYQAISRLRHRLNGVRRAEPVELETF